MVGTAWNYTSTNIRNLEFITLYEKAVGGKPDQFAAQAYTAIWLFADAVKSAGASRPEAVRNSLAKMTNLNTPLGIFSFTQDREPVHPTAVQVVRNGKFTILSR
jgi:branched-chain amino acid transport system substrate-binding protein